MSSITSADLEKQHGAMLRQTPWNQYGSPDLLHRALMARQPPLKVSQQAVRVWYNKYNIPPGAETPSTAQELEERCGDSIRHLALECRTSFRLCKALREKEPPVCITEKVATGWLEKYPHYY